MNKTNIANRLAAAAILFGMITGTANAAQTLVTDQSQNHDGGVTVPSDRDGNGDGKAGDRGNSKGYDGGRD